MRGGFADQAFVHRRELRYGSREFLAASDLARRLPYSPRISALIGSWCVIRRCFGSSSQSWRLPVIDLRVRRADVDAWREAHFGPARHGRLAQAVLDCPPSKSTTWPAVTSRPCAPIFATPAISG